MLIDHRADSGIHVDSGVYVPQYDSALLRESMTRFFPPAGLRVADLCTGSGYLALAAAKEGAAAVTALDMCPLAVECAQSNAQRVGADITALQGDWLRAKEFGPFDLVLANPPVRAGRSTCTARRCRSGIGGYHLGISCRSEWTTRTRPAVYARARVTGPARGVAPGPIGVCRCIPNCVRTRGHRTYCGSHC